ncbi:hypothetical protein [Salinigranum halophilum]|uniref:hypothetical protein n=1 Tax=Salinigranum halophilum TaxID=2565931 RepID=UPI00191C1E99|nr:hypothetical protein [Salinigranum halophilum]
MEQIDRGERQKTVSVWDGHLAALDEEGNEDHLEAVGHALQDDLDVERGAIDRSDVLRLALRLGLHEAVKENAAREL